MTGAAPPAHGRDIYRCRAEGFGPLLDFSANINPLGLPKGVVRALRHSAEQFDRYPDPQCRELRAALAARHHVAAEQILCGNGAADLIYRIAFCVKPKHALVPAPAFSEYAKALSESGCALSEPPLLAHQDSFPKDSLLDLITSETEILFLCNPNNPTGLCLPQDVMEAAAERCNRQGVLLVVDECFNEFLDDPDAHSLVPLLGRYPRMAILKAFTKTYAMAGLRLGYLLCGGADLAGKIASTGQAWSVSGPAQIAGIAALAETDYLERSRRLIKQERRYLKTALRNLGISAVSGEANFIFFRLGAESGFSRTAFFARLLEQGILVRNCANYPGLDDSCYRVAVKKRAENRALAAALKKIRRKE
jgi:threonine-phosphate decarboxylase